MTDPNAAQDLMLCKQANSGILLVQLYQYLLFTCQSILLLLHKRKQMCLATNATMEHRIFKLTTTQLHVYVAQGRVTRDKSKALPDHSKCVS